MEMWSISEFCASLGKARYWTTSHTPLERRAYRRAVRRKSTTIGMHGDGAVGDGVFDFHGGSPVGGLAGDEV